MIVIHIYFHCKVFDLTLRRGELGLFAYIKLYHVHLRVTATDVSKVNEAYRLHEC